MMLSRRAFTVSLTGSLAIGRTARAASYTMQLTSTASNDIDQEWLTQFKIAVEALSHGQIRANVYPGSQLGSAQSTIEGTALGTIEVAMNASGLFESLEPRFGVLAVPGLISSLEQGDRALLSPEFRAAMGTMGHDKGVQVLTVAGATPAAIVTRRPVRALSELAGMKIRVPGSALLIDQLKQLGAAPIAMSLGEVLPAFQNGTIDGVYAATTIFAALKYYDISKNMTLLPDTFILVLGIINRDFLTTVGPLAPVVLEAAHQADLKAAPWGEADVVNAAKVWAEHGGQSYSLSPADAKQYIDTVVPVALKSLTPAARTDYAALKAAADKIH